MITEQEYPVPLTQKELLIAADFAGLISAKIAEKEHEFAVVKRAFKDSIKELQEGLNLQLKKLQDKTEVRIVKLEITYNDPSPGKKKICNYNTGEVYTISDMTDEEKSELFALPEQGDVHHDNI